MSVRSAGDRRLHRHIERRDRLVGHHHAGIAAEGAGDADALLLSARQLARLAEREFARQLHEVEQLVGLLLDLLARLGDAEFLEHAADLRADRMAGIERLERVLEHDLQA